VFGEFELGILVLREKVTKLSSQNYEPESESKPESDNVLYQQRGKQVYLNQCPSSLLKFSRL